MGRSLLCRNHRLKQNNRIHSNKQGRAAVAFDKFDENVAFTNASFLSPQNSNDIVYIGDVEWDFEAATKLQWGFIGIGERLKGKTELWIEDYTSEYWKSAPDKALGR